MEIIRTIAPGFLITVHAEEPEYFVDALRGEDIAVIMAEYGEEIALTV